MDTHKPIHSTGDQQEFEAAMQLLAARIREAGECLLDLQNAIERLRVAREPALAASVEREAADCLRRAMRASG